MEELSSYKDRRREFVKPIQYEIQVPNIKRKDQEMSRGKMQSTPERYTVKKVEKEKVKNRTKQQRKAAKRKVMRNRAIAVALAGLVSFGGIKVYQNYKDSKNTITLEQALENGETIESLGLDEKVSITLKQDSKDDEIVEIGVDTELERLNKKMQQNLTYQELTELVKELVEFQRIVAKSKVKDVLNRDSITGISLHPAEGDRGAYIITPVGNYESSFISKISGEETISSEIANYINAIGRMQDIQKDMENGNISKSKVMEVYKDALEETSKFAAGKMELDEKGDIIMEKTKVSELEKAEKADEGFEFDD